MSEHKPLAFCMRQVHEDGRKHRYFLVRVPTREGLYLRVAAAVIVAECPKCGAPPKVPCSYVAESIKHTCRRCLQRWTGQHNCKGRIYRAKPHPERMQRADELAGRHAPRLAERRSDGVADDMAAVLGSP